MTDSHASIHDAHDIIRGLLQYAPIEAAGTIERAQVWLKDNEWVRATQPALPNWRRRGGRGA